MSSVPLNIGAPVVPSGGPRGPETPGPAKGPLEVPHSDGGCAWFSAFEPDGALICPFPGELRRLRSLASTMDSLCEALRALVAQEWRYNQLQRFGFADGGTVRTHQRTANEAPGRAPARGYARATCGRARAVVPATNAAYWISHRVNPYYHASAQIFSSPDAALSGIARKCLLRQRA